MKALSFMGHLSIKVKLNLVFLLVLILMAGVSGIQIVLFNSYINQYNNMMDNISGTNSINGILKEELDFEIREIAFGKIEFEHGKQYQLISTLLSQLDEIDEDDKHDLVKQEVDGIRRTMMTVTEQIDKLGQQITEGASSDERNTTLDYIYITTGIVEDQVQQLLKKKLEVSQGVQETIMNNINKNITIYSFVFIGIVILSFTFIWHISGSIAKPIRRLSENANHIAEGNLTVEPVIINTKNEIGDLCRSLNRMTDNLKEIIIGVRSTNDRVFSSSENIHASIQANRFAGEEVANATQIISENLHAQDDLVVRSATDFNDLFRGFNDILENITQIKHHADESLQLANQGNVQIDDFQAQFQGVKQAVEQVYRDTDELQNTAEEMEEILNLLRNIARETNVLSINASIEASRGAGGGQSFNVIAQRIKELANQSTSFSNSAGEKMTIVHERIAFIHEQMKTSVEEIIIGSEKAEQAKTVFQSIQQSNASVQNEVENITTDMQEAGDRMRSVHHMIADIKERSQASNREIASIVAMGEEQLSTMEEVSETSYTLVERIEEMNDNIKQFNV